MKKTLSFLLAFAMLFSLSAVGAAAANTVLSEQKLTCDGKSIECEKYNIDGSNYFRLRDIACLLNGTASRFSVGWDSDARVVSIVTGEAYEPNGSELDLSAGDQSSTAVPSSQTVMINGVERSDLSVYNIGGSNFFRLRDLGGALGFLVDYDKAGNTAVIKSLAGVENPGEWLMLRKTYCDIDGAEYCHTDYTYNDKKQLVSEKDVYLFGGTGTYTVDYAYDGAGNRVCVTRASDDGTGYWNKTDYSYDSAGRLLSEIGSDTEGVSYILKYTYASDGSKLSESYEDPNYRSESEYSYDAEGRLVADHYESSGGSYSYASDSEYTYDDSGNMLSEDNTASDGTAFRTVYTYDEAGRMLSSDSMSGSYRSITEMTYDAAGNMLSEKNTTVYGTGDYATTHTYVCTCEYDSDNRLIYEKYDGDGYAYEYAYSYYDNGEMRTKEGDFTTGSRIFFLYDSGGRLLERRYEDGAYSEEEYYAYDALGNMLSARGNMRGADFFTVCSYDYAAASYTVRTSETR